MINLKNIKTNNSLNAPENFKSILVLKKSLISLLKNYLRILIYRWLTRNALPIFVRGNDVISASPNVLGHHEEHVIEVLKLFSRSGMSDFLVDIGANIGLISCQSGKYFDQIIMFEPNPLCFGVLETNAMICLNKVSYEINQFGLAQNEGNLSLKIPHNNWGGAFVVSSENIYNEEVLYSKDGFKSNQLDNYLTLSIKLKDATLTLKNLFARLQRSGFKKGAIKIDVEGMEISILKAIAETVPSEFELSIIFEYLDSEIDGKTLLSFFSSKTQLYALRKYPSGGAQSLVNLFKYIMNSHQHFTIEPWRPGIKASDFILLVNHNSGISVN